MVLRSFSVLMVLITPSDLWRKKKKKLTNRLTSPNCLYLATLLLLLRHYDFKPWINTKYISGYIFPSNAKLHNAMFWKSALKQCYEAKTGTCYICYELVQPLKKLSQYRKENYCNGCFGSMIQHHLSACLNSGSEMSSFMVPVNINIKVSYTERELVKIKPPYPLFTLVKSKATCL